MIADRPIRIIRPPSFSPLNLLRELRGLWQYRDLFYTLSVHRIKVRYKQSLLGLAWAILQPLSLMLIYTVVFEFFVKILDEKDASRDATSLSAAVETIWSYCPISICVSPEAV